MCAPGPRLVLITGCSGGGKSTLLAELARRGHRTVAEPGRRIVADEVASGGSALPWIDLEAFLRRALDMALADHEAALCEAGPVFFDRGLVDAACALQAQTFEPALRDLAARHRYHRLVFMAPPWPDIFRADTGRRHGYEAAVAEYERLRRDVPALGYDLIDLPRTTTAARADFVLATLAGSGRSPPPARQPWPRNSG